MSGHVLVLTSDAAQVLASVSSDDGGGVGIVFLLLLAGPLFYMRVYLKYRNTDKRHHHESETRSEMIGVQTTDTFVEHRKGLRGSRMKGANNRRL